MARLILSILVGVTLLGTLACEGSKKSVTLRKVLGTGNEQYSTNIKAIVEKSKAEGCLRVDEIVRAMGTITDAGLSVYTADVALGHSESGDLEAFEAIADKKFSQDVLLRGQDAEKAIDVINKPTHAQLRGSQLLSSFVGRFILGIETLDKDCTTASLKRSHGANPVEHKVIAKSGTSLSLQNTETLELIRYEFSAESERLLVTSYRDSSDEIKVCDRELPPLIRTGYMIARQPSTTDYVISYDFAKVIAGFVRDSNELKDVLEQAEKGSPIKVSATYFHKLIENIQSDAFTREQCK